MYDILNFFKLKDTNINMATLKIQNKAFDEKNIGVSSALYIYHLGTNVFDW